MWKLTLIAVILGFFTQGSLGRGVGGRGGGNEMEGRPHRGPTAHVVIHRSDCNPEPELPDNMGPLDKILHIRVNNIDPFHGNAMPGAPMWACGKDIHAKCVMKPGTQEGLTGTIYMQQDMMGSSPVRVAFDLSGFSAGHGHNHTFAAHRYGNTADQCTMTGPKFSPPRNSMQLASDHDSEEEEPSVETAEEHSSHDRSHHKGHGHAPGHHGHRHAPRHRGCRGCNAWRSESVLGDLACDDDGNMVMTDDFDSITLTGFHSLFGRSIVVTNTDGGDILGCCTVAHADGSEHWGYDPTKNMWLATETGNEAEPDAHHGHHDHHHDTIMPKIN